MFSPVIRILLFALWALSAAQAGPLGFEDIDSIVRPDKIVNGCESCGFITTYETLEPPADTEELIAILGFITALMLIGLIGVRFRVRASSVTPEWRKIRELQSGGTVRRLESGTVRRRRDQ